MRMALMRSTHAALTAEAEQKHAATDSILECNMMPFCGVSVQLEVVLCVATIDQMFSYKQYIPAQPLMEKVSKKGGK